MHSINPLPQPAVSMNRLARPLVPTGKTAAQGTLAAAMLYLMTAAAIIGSLALPAVTALSVSLLIVSAITGGVAGYGGARGLNAFNRATSAAAQSMINQSQADTAKQLETLEKNHNNSIDSLSDSLSEAQRQLDALKHTVSDGFDAVSQTIRTTSSQVDDAVQQALHASKQDYIARLDTVQQHITQHAANSADIQETLDAFMHEHQDSTADLQDRLSRLTEVMEHRQSSVQASPGESVESGVQASPGESIESGVQTSPGESIESGVQASPRESIESGVQASPGESIESGMQTSPGESIESGVQVSPGKSIESGVQVSPGKSIESGVQVSPRKNTEDTPVIAALQKEVAIIKAQLLVRDAIEKATTNNGIGDASGENNTRQTPEERHIQPSRLARTKENTQDSGNSAPVLETKDTGTPRTLAPAHKLPAELASHLDNDTITPDTDSLDSSNASLFPETLDPILKKLLAFASTHKNKVISDDEFSEFVGLIDSATALLAPSGTSYDDSFDSIQHDLEDARELANQPDSTLDDLKNLEGTIAEKSQAVRNEVEKNKSKIQTIVQKLKQVIKIESDENSDRARLAHQEHRLITAGAAFDSILQKFDGLVAEATGILTTTAQAKLQAYNTDVSDFLQTLSYDALHHPDTDRWDELQSRHTALAEALSRIGHDASQLHTVDTTRTTLTALHRFLEDPYQFHLDLPTITADTPTKKNMTAIIARIAAISLDKSDASASISNPTPAPGDQATNIIDVIAYFNNEIDALGLVSDFKSRLMSIQDQLNARRTKKSNAGAVRFTTADHDSGLTAFFTQLESPLTAAETTTLDRRMQQVLGHSSRDYLHQAPLKSLAQFLNSHASVQQTIHDVELICRSLHQSTQDNGYNLLVLLSFRARLIKSKKLGDQAAFTEKFSKTLWALFRLHNPASWETIKTAGITLPEFERLFEKNGGKIPTTEQIKNLGKLKAGSTNGTPIPIIAATGSGKTELIRWFKLMNNADLAVVSPIVVDGFERVTQETMLAFVNQAMTNTLPRTLVFDEYTMVYTLDESDKDTLRALNKPALNAILETATTWPDVIAALAKAVDHKPVTVAYLSATLHVPELDLCMIDDIDHHDYTALQTAGLLDRLNAYYAAASGDAKIAQFDRLYDAYLSHQAAFTVGFKQTLDTIKLQLDALKRIDDIKGRSVDARKRLLHVGYPRDQVADISVSDKPVLLVDVKKDKPYTLKHTSGNSEDFATHDALMATLKTIATHSNLIEIYYIGKESSVGQDFGPYTMQQCDMIMYADPDKLAPDEFVQMRGRYRGNYADLTIELRDLKLNKYSGRDTSNLKDSMHASIAKSTLGRTRATALVDAYRQTRFIKELDHYFGAGIVSDYVRAVLNQQPSGTIPLNADETAYLDKIIVDFQAGRDYDMTPLVRRILARSQDDTLRTQISHLHALTDINTPVTQTSSKSDGAIVLDQGRQNSFPVLNAFYNTLNKAVNTYNETPTSRRMMINDRIAIMAETLSKQHAYLNKALMTYALHMLFDFKSDSDDSGKLKKVLKDKAISRATGDYSLTGFIEKIKQELKPLEKTQTLLDAVHQTDTPDMTVLDAKLTWVSHHPTRQL